MVNDPNPSPVTPSVRHRASHFQIVRADTQAPRATSATHTPAWTRWTTASRPAGGNRAFLWVFTGPLVGCRLCVSTTPACNRYAL